MDHDGGAVGNGAEQVGRGDRVVHDQGNTVGLANFGDLFDVDDVELGIADALHEKGLGAIVDRLLPAVQIARCDIANPDAEFGQGVGEEADRTPVQMEATISSPA